MHKHTKNKGISTLTFLNPKEKQKMKMESHKKRQFTKIIMKLHGWVDIRHGKFM